MSRSSLHERLTYVHQVCTGVENKRESKLVSNSTSLNQKRPATGSHQSHLGRVSLCVCPTKSPGPAPGHWNKCMRLASSGIAKAAYAFHRSLAEESTQGQQPPTTALAGPYTELKCIHSNPTDQPLKHADSTQSKNITHALSSAVYANACSSSAACSTLTHQLSMLQRLDAPACHAAHISQ